MQRIDREVFLRSLERSDYGTGTLAERAGVATADVLGLIANEEGPEDVLKKVGKILPGGWAETDPLPITAEGYGELTVDEVKDLVTREDLDGATVKSLELERPAEEQRVTLLRWLDGE